MRRFGVGIPGEVEKGVGLIRKGILTKAVIRVYGVLVIKND